MFPSQKTTMELSVDWMALERHAWAKFHPKVAALQSMVDVQKLLADAPPLGSPSSQFYANLAEFLLTYRMPKTAGADEREIYIQLVERFQDSGTLDAGTATASLAALRGPGEGPT